MNVHHRNLSIKDSNVKLNINPIQSNDSIINYCFKPKKFSINSNELNPTASPTTCTSELNEDINKCNANDSNSSLKLPVIASISNNCSPRRRLKNSVPKREKVYKKLERLMRGNVKQIIQSHAFGTRAGQEVIGQDKQNQDSVLVEEIIGGNGKSKLFAVADGHGKYGEKLFILNRLTKFYC